MSSGNGTRNGQSFDKFHKRLGKPPFVPDFLDSLARVMADPTSCLQERVLAWVKYFAWGNYSEYAIRVLGDGSEYELRQKDCAEDLAWLETGARAEWLDAPPEIRLLELNRLGVKPISKNRISRAFELNEIRRSIERDTGHKIQPTASPTVAGSREFHKRKGEYRRFMELAKVTHSREFEELQVARSTANRLRKFFLSEFKLWKAAQALGKNGGTSLEASEAEEAVGRKVDVAPEEPSSLPAPAPPAEVAPDTRQGLAFAALVEVVESAAVPYPLARPASAEILPNAQKDPALVALVEVIEFVAVPVIGESPTDEQYVEIYRRLNGASAEQFKERMEAKKAKGKLNSVMVLKHLADDCARSKDRWKPPDDSKQQQQEEQGAERVKRVAALARAWSGTGGDS